MNPNFQSFGTNPQSQTQVYPGGTVRIVQNANPLAQDTKWITTATIAQQQSQEQHPHQHPQIIQSNKVQSQTIYYSQGQNQSQGLVVKPTSINGNAITTPPMSYNSTIYSAQGQVQGQGQAISLYSTSPMNIQMANTPPNNAVNTISGNNSGHGTSTIVMAQQTGTNVINEITSSYAVAQPIQAQESKSYSNPIFVLPSPSTPTPQINFTTSTTTHSNPTIVQVQQTPPQTTLQQSTNTSQYIIAQKSNGQIGMTSTQQVILQAPPTPYGTSPTSAQVQVITQNNGGNNSFSNNTIVSPTQIQYQYSVTPPLSTEKEAQIKQDGKVSPEMTLLNVDKVETSTLSSAQDSSDTQTFSSSLISNPGRLFNKISISSPTSSTMYSVDSSSVSLDLSGQTQEKDEAIVTKENLSPAGEDKGKLERKSSISQSNGKSKMEIVAGVSLKEEHHNSMDINSTTNTTTTTILDQQTTKDTGNTMNIDNTDSKTNNINGLTVMTTTATPLDPSTMMSQTITNSQGVIQTPTTNATNQNINMIQGIQGVGVNLGVGITTPMNKVNGINIINGMNGMNNVNYISNVNTMSGISTNPTNVNVNGVNSIHGVQVATAIPQTINTMNTMNTMNNMNIINNNNGNIISISPTQSTVPINTNNSINLYYNQGQNIMNTTQNATVNYANSGIMKTSTNKGTNGYNARTKNSHIVDPDVPIEVLIKRRKNTEAARRSRLRKAERIQVLTEIVHNLEEKNKEYTLKIAELQGEQANWIKKENEYTSKIKQLQDKLNDSNPNSANDENDKNSFNISTPTTTNTDTETTVTESVSTPSVANKDSSSENK
eukprot:jgi/Orpsp1_1/1180265/evm.model.c7180000072723.1